MKVSAASSFFLCFLPCCPDGAFGWAPNHVLLPRRSSQRFTFTALDMAAVGIFFGTSTGNTQTAADMIYEAFGGENAAEPIDVDTLKEDQLAQVFGEHDALVVGTPTWNTGAESERSGTGWDDLYYAKLPTLKRSLEGKKVAVFGLGDQVSYAENYADATGELFDVFESLGCKMLGAWSMDGYEHEDSKSIRGDKFCGLLLDMVNQEELSEGRITKWVAQLMDEGILDGSSTKGTEAAVNGDTGTDLLQKEELEHESVQLREELDGNSDLLDQNIGAHSSGGFTPYYNSLSGRTMWVSQDGRKSYMTVEPTVQKSGLSP